METINLRTQISKTWKDFFKKYTSPQDVAKISLQHEIGFHTLHNIKICNGNIANEKNKNAIYDLAKVAIENAKKTMIESQADLKSMEDSFSEIINNN